MLICHAIGKSIETLYEIICNTYARWFTVISFLCDYAMFIIDTLSILFSYITSPVAVNLKTPLNLL